MHHLADLQCRFEETRIGWSTFVFTIILCLLTTSIVNARPSINAAAILDGMVQKYGQLLSYQDEGIVITTEELATAGVLEKVPFKTFFERPDRFRFEWINYSISKRGNLNVILSDGKEVFTYWEPNKYEKSENLGLAIAGATGISRGSAYTVSTMLLPELVAFSLTGLTDLTVVGEEVFEGTLCYHLNGKHPRGVPLGLHELWIGKQDLLLRKIRTQTKYPNRLIVEEEIHRNIRINQSIANEVFAFKPPIAEHNSQNDSRDANAGALVSEEAPSWSEFASQEGRFSLLMPATPQAQTLIIESPRGRLEHHLFAATKGGFVCVVDYVDITKQIATPRNEEAIFDAARDEFLKAAQAKLASETPVSMDGHRGREIRMQIIGGEARLRVFLIEGRLFQFAITKIHPGKKPDGEMEKFFDSLKVFSVLTPLAMRNEE